MSLIYCAVNEFAANTNLYKIDDKGETHFVKHVTNDKLAEFIPLLCEKENIENIHLIGSQQYLEGIVEQIELEEISKYNNKILNIEVN